MADRQSERTPEGPDSSAQRPSQGPSTRPPNGPDNPYAVRVISQKISSWIARLGPVWLDGEIAQLNRRTGSRAVFITLRDTVANFSLPITCSTTVLDDLGTELKEGARVLVHCKADFWAERGNFSMRAREIRQVGLGELLARIERLRQALEAEGLFDPRRKKRMPFLPKTIGLVTGRDSAAEHDVLTNARRRWPGVTFKVINCAVQGRTAAAEVRSAIASLEADQSVEIIIVARGGGSVEDLLPFSDETLCRYAAALRTPLVSAIGHEPDTPLLDYVADLRASTPTDAAKRVVPDVAEERALVGGGRDRIRAAVTRYLANQWAFLEQQRSRPSLSEPASIVTARSADVVRQREAIRRTVDHHLVLAHSSLEQMRARLVALSPQATLERGYAVLQHEDGHVVSDPAQVAPGQSLVARVSGGSIRLTARQEPG